MKTDIFIRSYRGDFAWLNYALKSCSISAEGFNTTHVVVPIQDKDLLNLTREHVHSCHQHCNGYLHQQITKLKADEYSSADVIWHIDSDTIFKRTVTPQEFIKDGKVIMFYEPYSRLDCRWQAITEAAVGFSVENEFMRRPPHVYPRWLYGEVRAHLDKVHGNWEKFIASRQNNEFSEYNVMGAVAWQFFRDRFEWVLPEYSESFVQQYWSWGGIDNSRQEIEDILTKAVNL